MLNYGGTYAVPRPDLGGVLSEFMIEPDSFIGTMVAPYIDVAVPAGAHSIITREGHAKRVDAKRAKSAGYNRIKIGAEDGTFQTKEHGLEIPVPDDERSTYANDFDLEAESTLQLGHHIKLEQEIRIADLCLDPAVWTGADLQTDVSGEAWATVTNNIVKHVAAAKEKVRKNTGVRANTLIMSEATFQTCVLPNEKIMARFPGATAITEQMIRANLTAIFGLRKLLVGPAVKDSADEGQAASLGDVWSGTYVMVAHIPEAGAPRKVPGIMRTYRWFVDAPGEQVIEQYREEQIRSWILRARHNTQEKVMDPYFGHLLKIA